MAQAAYGAYIGDGTTGRLISGVPFAPSFVLVWGYEWGFGGFMWRNSVFDAQAQHGATSFPTGVTTQRVISLESNGFKITGGSTLENVNVTGYHYYWTALADSSETAMKHGFYTGDGTGNRVIPSVPGPHMILLYDDTGDRTYWWRDTHDVGQYVFQGDFSGGFVGNVIIAGSLGTFTVHSNMNVAGRQYFYTVFAISEGFFERQRYTGNGTDNRNISFTSVAFQPHLVWIDCQQIAAGIRSLYHDDSYNAGDSTLLWRGAVATTADAVQQANSNGFQVGAGVYANFNTEIYHYSCFGPGQALAFPDVSSLPPPPLGGGGGILSLSPYTKYKSLRESTKIYNNLLLTP